MKLDVDVHLYIHDAHDESPLLKLILERITQMAVDLTALTAAVAAEDTVIDSAIALIGGIPAVVSQAVAAALTANGVADAAAQTAADAAAADVQAKTTALQAALTANTPTPPVTP
jgi:hypothetical protein